MIKVAELTDDNFEKEVKETEKDLTVVDFWATWCGPCQRFGPIFTETAQEMGERVAFAKVNIDDAQRLASQCNVQSIPCVVAFDKEGNEKGRFVGALPKERLIEEISKIL